MEERDASDITRFLAGDDQAFSSLVDRYQSAILGLATRLTGDSQFAEDLFQEIFLKVYRSVSELREKERFKSWLFTMAVRHVRRAMRLRRETLSAGDWLEEIEDPGGADTEQLDLDDKERLRDAVTRLPPRQREVVLLRGYQGLSYAELADILQVTEETARANFYQGLKRLKAWLNREL